MKTLLREAGFAVLAWFVPFLMSVCIFPLKRSCPPLFESVMGVTLVATTAGLGCLYLRRSTRRLIATTARIGVTWMLANWMLDGLMFSSGPMKMSFHQYASEIAGAYLMIPIITLGLGVAAHISARRVEAATPYIGLGRANRGAASRCLSRVPDLLPYSLSDEIRS